MSIAISKHETKNKRKIVQSTLKWLEEKPSTVTQSSAKIAKGITMFIFIILFCVWMIENEAINRKREKKNIKFHGKNWTAEWYHIKSEQCCQFYIVQ